MASVGDEGLAPAQHPTVVLSPRGRADAAQVAARVGLGERDGGGELTGVQPGKPASLLCGSGEVDEVGADEVFVTCPHDVDRRGADSRELVDDDAAKPEVVRTAAAMLLWSEQPAKPCRACLAPQIWIHVPLVVPAGEVRLDLARDELSHGVAEMLVLLIEEGLRLHGHLSRRARARGWRCP